MEERREEAAMPQRQTQKLLRLLYLGTFLSSWGDRMWGFAVPILLTKAFPTTLLPASLFAFTGQLSCVLFGTVVGQWIDHKGRKQVLLLSLFVQNGSVFICSLLLYAFLWLRNGDNEEPQAGWRVASIWGLFGVLNLFGGVAALASMAENIAVSKDWVVVISAQNKTFLTAANAMLTRIGLLCKVAAPVAFGLVMNYASTQIALLFVCLWNVLSVIPESLALLYIYHRVPALHHKLSSTVVIKEEVIEEEELEMQELKTSLMSATSSATEPHEEQEEEREAEARQRNQEQHNETEGEEQVIQRRETRAPAKETSQKKSNPFVNLYTGWKTYVQTEEVFLASFAFSLLFFTALAPGALLSAFLLTHGLSELSIALFQAVSAAVGMISTFLTPSLFTIYGKEKTGLYSLWQQTVCLVICLLFFFGAASRGTVIMSTLESAGRWLHWDVGESFVEASAIWMFLVFLILSRVGLWSFDLAERQIMQEAVPEDKRGTINSVEYSLTNVFSLLSYLMGMIVPDPEHFGILVIVSFLAVFIAACLFTRWYQKQSPRFGVV
ncbi:Solute carrier family 40 protein [Balamuthia mandrillaris]